jgi:hypothetical protein
MRRKSNLRRKKIRARVLVDYFIDIKTDKLMLRSGFTATIAEKVSRWCRYGA